MQDKLGTIQTWFKNITRRVILYSGKEYIVLPLNPRKLKNRGRHVIILDKVLVNPDHENGDYIAKVRYLDNHRFGRVDFGDLEPIDQADCLYKGPVKKLDL